MSDTDKYYIERCLDGHPDDFRYLVRRYQGVLLAHLVGKLGNRDSAEEVAQETKEAIDIAAPGGGYVLASDHSLHDGISVENILEMRRVGTEYGGAFYGQSCR